MNILLKISSAISYRKVGIIIVCRTKSSYDISYYQMLKKGNSVDISYCQEGLKSFEEIDFQAEKYPTILCVQGTGLVQRMMAGSYVDIKQSIPNINTDEYLIELDETNPGEKLVALCRKEQVDTILGEDSLKRIPIHNISLGFINISRYLQLFAEEIKCFEFEGSAINLSENRILDITRNVNSNTVQDYFFADKNRKASEILALSAGLAYFTRKKWNTFQIQSIDEKIKEYTASRLSTFILYNMGAILFLLLLINFFVFDYYHTKHEELEVNAGGMISMQNEINRLQSDLNAKHQFIQQNNVPANFAFAYYADRLASYVSDGIGFSELSVCPVESKVKEDKVIVFQSNTLRVSGTAPNSVAFSNFLEKINKSSWAKKLNKQVYVFNNETGDASFEIEIELNHAID